MKWLFLTLLLINLGLFMLIYPQQQANEGSSVLADIGELKLANELQSTADQSGVEVAADLNAVRSTEPVGEAPVTEATAERVGSPETVQNKPLSVDDRLAEVAADAQSAEEPVKKTARCAMLGYVDTRSAAEEISVRLRALGFKPELQSESRNEQAGYWVLIPQQASRRDAVRIAKKLEKSGVSDLWRFTSGKLVHAISLGLFRDEIRAGDRKREIDALGFDSVIQPRYREKTNYWLKYQKGKGAVLDDKDWSKLVRDFPELINKEIECQ
ncbi:MAG: hypothetical protein P8163_15350 [Candidatus Thiodiazotropha sp.]